MPLPLQHHCRLAALLLLLLPQLCPPCWLPLLLPLLHQLCSFCWLQLLLLGLHQSQTLRGSGSLQVAFRPQPHTGGELVPSLHI